MQQKNTELPQQAVPSCLVYWPSCFQTPVNEKQQKPVDKEKRGLSEYGSHQRAREHRKAAKGKRCITSATRQTNVGDRGSVGLSEREADAWWTKSA